MLCSHCYKKIPEGEEIQKASSSFFRTSWGEGWGGSEVVCRQCAIKDRRRQKTYLVLFFAAFIIIFLSVPIIIFVTKINN